MLDHPDNRLALGPLQPGQPLPSLPELLPGVPSWPSLPLPPAWGGPSPGGGAPVSRAITVAATTYWTNTGIELRAGQYARVHATGLWRMGPGDDLHGPQGIAGTRDGCPFGSLVANIGIISGGTFHCLGQQGEMVAERDGILYLGPNDNMLDDNLGAATVTISSNGRPSAQLMCGTIGLQAQQHALQSSWAELRGWHTILAVPTQQVVAQRHLADVAVATYDAWYASHRDLAGGVPYKGQPIRFVPSPGIDEYGALMFAGNPIRVDPDIGTRFLLVQDPQLVAWGFVHELGHDFNNINGGRYMIGGGPGEAWANVFSLYTLRRFGHPDGQRPHCEQAQEYLDQGKPYAELRSDAWISLCMLMELQQRHGWGMYERFFRAYNGLDQTTVPGDDSDDRTRWTWLRDALSRAAGADVTPVLRKYRVPLAS